MLWCYILRIIISWKFSPKPRLNEREAHSHHTQNRQEIHTRFIHMVIQCLACSLLEFNVPFGIHNFSMAILSSWGTHRNVNGNTSVLCMPMKKNVVAILVAIHFNDPFHENLLNYFHVSQDHKNKEPQMLRK